MTRLDQVSIVCPDPVIRHAALVYIVCCGRDSGRMASPAVVTALVYIVCCGRDSGRVTSPAVVTALVYIVCWGRDSGRMASPAVDAEVCRVIIPLAGDL